jgi:hypothetical protein
VRGPGLMRFLFAFYLVMVIGGLAYLSTIGLLHH